MQNIRHGVCEERKLIPPALDVLVARFLFGLAQRYGPNFLSTSQLALVNGQLGSYTSGAPAGGGYPEMMPRVTAMTVRDGKVCAIWDVANPEKFTASPIAPRR